MNTPNHATDEQIDALWKLLQLETARNFVQAYMQREIKDECGEKSVSTYNGESVETL